MCIFSGLRKQLMSTCVGNKQYPLLLDAAGCPKSFGLAWDGCNTRACREFMDNVDEGDLIGDEMPPIHCARSRAKQQPIGRAKGISPKDPHCSHWRTWCSSYRLVPVRKPNPRSGRKCLTSRLSHGIVAEKVMGAQITVKMPKRSTTTLSI